MLCLWNPFHKPCQDIIIYFPIPYTFQNSFKNLFLVEVIFAKRTILDLTTDHHIHYGQTACWTAILAHATDPKIGALSILFVFFVEDTRKHLPNQTNYNQKLDITDQPSNQMFLPTQLYSIPHHMLKLLSGNKSKILDLSCSWSWTKATQAEYDG